MYAQEHARLRFTQLGDKSSVFVIEHGFHECYGIAFPLTFQFILPKGSSDLTAWKKETSDGQWIPIKEKHQVDVFNDIEAARFDYQKDIAYVSALFGTSDSLFLEICNSGKAISAVYQGIDKYYDNRKAAVTLSADDWTNDADWKGNFYFKNLLPIFRSYGLYVTVGVITGSCDDATWKDIQVQLDSGYLEVASHSQTHPHTPYEHPVHEIFNSKNDIITHLTLPKYFCFENHQYVYTWLAPFGDYDRSVDLLLGVYGYVAARLYANLEVMPTREHAYADTTCINTSLPSWNALSNHFEPFYPTVEIGVPNWGGGDTSLVSLNTLFDKITSQGGVYHLMWHPEQIWNDKERDYFKEHLKYISNQTGKHPDIWYVNLGLLYIYHMMQEANH
jgi:peptidoglycan/xylan/chitin deacetylase (PgdA/CDA1 family)